MAVKLKHYRTTPEANNLLLEGTLALSEVEHEGVRVDRQYLETALDQTAQKIRTLEEEIRADENYRVWQKMFGEKTNLGSPEQLSKVVFGELGFKAGKKTKSKNRDAADESAFEGVDLPLVKKYFQAAKLRKGRGTYLTGIQRELVCHVPSRDPKQEICKVHPFYNLNTVATFRSSSDNPNWQNVPTRNEFLAEMVRRCYIPMPGCQFVEIDYKQIEVKLGCPYHNDPNMIRYMTDPDSDMHRDLCMQIFFLSKDEYNKSSRHLAKNKFVFPQFYGDFYIRCAKNMWEAIGFQNIRVGKDNDGESLYKHLKAKGIHELGKCDPKERPVEGTFEHHIKKIEDHFWGKRFPGYAQWKKDYYSEYLQTGGFQFLTGFAVNGIYKKNDVTNYPIQGSAFHCLLWSLIRIVRSLKRLKMRSRVVGQIHDCVVGNVHPRERDDYIHLCHKIMVEDLMKAWGWINVPIETEAEVCPVDQPWFNKMAMRANGDVWEPADLRKWAKRYGDWALQV